MTFAFDERYAMFDVTPVENQFILEYLAGAKGDYVKVYLYGLLCCYHPKKEMDIAAMSRELNLTEDVILAAFRYWERQRLVRRISDNPPSWQYINIKQMNLSAAAEGPEPEYARFSRDIENAFEGERDFHGSEIAACYEWKEDMGLSTETVIMLLKYMARTRGKSFKIKDAEKLAIRLSEEEAYSAEDAEQVLGRDEAMTSGLRKVLRQLGMRFNPSDANLALYRKWTEEWHFTQAAIEDACDRTGTSTPSLALVDAILDGARQDAGDGRELGKEDLDAAETKRRNLKEVLKEVGQYGAATPAQQKQYARLAEIYPKEVILLAAKECAAKQKHFDSVVKLLDSWQERGFTDEKQIREHIAAFHGKEEFLKTLRQKWAGRDTDVGQKTLAMLDKWESGMGFSREMITLAADEAFEAKRPIAYMDKVLTDWAGKGITTPEAAQEEKKKRAEAPPAAKKTGGKTVAAQQYTQRDYSNEDDEAFARMLSMNGGDGDA